ncbi:hypothetical protein PBY51_012384 [Eleginops maclovinus]|uniref:Uncharacterized protein n=1 Tax=Eleginops maclovinus TaxID=56733 RepID=A0AAN7XQ50_ELEMC|nr:hypothetical protein PBY51_012384 [Eleginops maclovinus]
MVVPTEETVHKEGPVRLGGSGSRSLKQSLARIKGLSGGRGVLEDGKLSDLQMKRLGGKSDRRKAGPK